MAFSVEIPLGLQKKYPNLNVGSTPTGIVSKASTVSYTISSSCLSVDKIYKGSETAWTHLTKGVSIVLYTFSWFSARDAFIIACIQSIVLGIGDLSKITKM